MLKNVIIALFVISFLVVRPARAQDGESVPSGPVYVIETGDTFYSIAVEFGVTVEDLVQANPNADPNFLSIGQEIVIPGLEGVTGRLMAETIPLGETLRTLSIRNEIPTSSIVTLNHLTSPAEVYAGASLIIPQQEEASSTRSHYLLDQGQSLFQVAASSNSNPWLLAEINQLSSPWSLLPGEAIFDQSTTAGISLIAPTVQELTINPLPIQQGITAVVQIKTAQPVELSGSLAGWPLHFMETEPNTYIALQGVHVMAEPGIYPFTISGVEADGKQFQFEQMVVLQALGYIQEKIDGVDPATIDSANTKPEDDRIRAVISNFTPEKYWDGPFLVPGFDPEWITSTFGNRRSYNGGPYTYFHTGLDYGGGTGLPIKAPAAGVIVFAETVTVRGGSTIIDHGWGVYSGFWHQSEIKVQVGDRVEAGQEIGLVGGTGRVTGPHLHWEVWVNGVHVDPYTWLERSYP